MAFFPTWSTLGPAAALGVSPEDVRPPWWLFLFLARSAVLALSLSLGLILRRPSSSPSRSALALTLWGTAVGLYLDSLDGTASSNLVYLLFLLSLALFADFFGESGSKKKKKGDVGRSYGEATACALLAVVYGCATLWKVNEDWLTAGQPLARWLVARGVLPPVVGGGPASAAIVLSWISVALEAAACVAFAAPASLSDRSRRLLVVLLTLFHATNATLFNLGALPWLCIGMLVLLAPAGSSNPLAAASPVTTSTLTSPPTGARLVRLATLTLAIAPTLLSLSHSLSLSPTLHTRSAMWTREYYGFCWRFRLLDVRGGSDTQFYVTPREGEAAGRRMPFDVSRILTPLQQAKVACNPVLLQETAHILATHWRRGTGETIAVSVDTACSLNGRPAQPVVDPDANLVAHPRGKFPLPFTTVLPSRSKWFV
jgi:hypothetical protein